MKEESKLKEETAVLMCIIIGLVLLLLVLFGAYTSEAGEWECKTFENSLVTTNICMKVEFDNETDKAIVYSYAEMREK